MLAEIFIMQLEITAIAARMQKAAPSNNTQFVPFNLSCQFTFKDGTVWVGRE